MFKLYKIFFISDIESDSKAYSMYCNKNNLPKVLEQITTLDADVISLIPLVFTFDTFKKCLANSTNFPLS